MVLTPWMAKHGELPGTRNRHINELILGLLSDPEGPSSNPSICRMTKTLNDITAMAGAISQGTDAENDGQKIFKTIID
eukprot:232628-Heterocapsa_arctica.AAC.1